MSMKRTWPISNRISGFTSEDISLSATRASIALPWSGVENKAGFEVVADRSEQLAQHHSIRVFFRRVFRFP
jgi:hypothetical protein